MAVGNSLAKKRTDMYQNAQVATYEVAGHKIELTPEIIKNYMISGNKERVTMEEVTVRIKRNWYISYKGSDY